MKKYFEIILILLAIIVGNAVAWGAGSQTIRSDPGYLIEKWETEDGLPENSATAIAQTLDGYIWFGTFDGLVRFDGTEFRVFNPANTPELPSAGIINLHVDRRGWLWVSTDAGLVVREDAQWRQLTRNNPNSADYARTITERANGDLFITTFNGKAFEFANGQLTELPPPPGEKGQGYFGGVDEDGHWWAAQFKFIGLFENGGWVPMTNRPNNSKREVACGAARDGSLWLLDDRQLSRLRRGVEVSRMTLAEPVGGVWSMSEDSQGNVWFATFNKGICRVTPDGTMTRWNTANGWFDQGRCVFEDRERNLWVGSSGDGLARFTPRRFQYFDLKGGRYGEEVQSVWPDAHGGLWAGTRGHGLLDFSATGVTSLALPAPFIAPFFVSSVLADHAGRLWVGTERDSAWLLEAGGVRHLPPAQTGGSLIHALFEDSHGRVWVSGASGVSVFDGNEVRVFGPDQGLPVSVVTCFAEDASGTLWLANGEGVFRTDGEHNLVEVRDADDESIRGIGCLNADADGAMWLGSADRGLLRFKAGKLASLDARTGLPIRAIQGMVTDTNGYLWMTSGRSVLRARINDLRAAADGQIQRIECHRFDASDGLPVAEFARERQPDCVRDATGRLWFATAKGLAMIDPATVRLNDIPPPVRVEWLSYFRPSRVRGGGNENPGEEVLVQLFEPFPAPLSLPAGSRRLEIHYAALSYVAPDKVQFQVSLDGGDGNWQDTGNRRVAYYYDLAPGKHDFRVRAANNDGVWNETGARLAFTVLPFYWQTWWFRGGAVLLLAAISGGVVWLGVRARLRRALERARSAEELQESEERMALATAAANLGIWIRDLVTNEIWATDKWRELFGFATSERIDFDGYQQKLHPEDREKVLQIQATAIGGEGQYETEYRVGLPDGEVRWIASRGRVEFDGAGKPVLLRGASLDITRRKQAEEMAQNLSGRLIHAQEAERMRLARELHDDLSQSLALLAVELDLFGQKPPAAGCTVSERMQVFSAQVRALSSDVHRLSHELHPAKLEQLGLEAAVRSFCKELGTTQLIVVECEFQNVPRALPDDVALCLYRIVQEGLQNVIKHSGAIGAKVALRADEKELWLEITDQGSGFESLVTTGNSSLGLVGMRERVRLVHGQILIQSHKGEGTRIEVRVPLAGA